MNTAVLERPPLTQIIGTVVKIIDPPAANKPGKIHLDDGKILSAFAEKISYVQPGGTYDFGCKINGVYKNVHTVRPAAAPRAQAQTARQPVRQSAPVEPPHQEPQRPTQNGNGNNQYFRPTSPKDARRMFICSQMNALITSHQVQPNAQAIADMIQMLADAYDATLGAEDQ